MGQKVNPHGLRVGVIKDWDSRWYAREDKVGDLVVEDYNIRKYLKNKLYAAGVAKIEIERSNGKVKINLWCSRPGVVIGKAGAEIENLRKEMETRLGKSVNLNIVEVRSPDLNAQLVAENIAAQLEKRISFRRAMKKAMQQATRLGAKGIKVTCGGRLGGAEIARSESYHEGTIPLQTIRADIEYGFAEAATTYGRIGVKVWIYKGEILTQTLRTTPRTLDTSKPYQERRERPRRDRRDGERRGGFKRNAERFEKRDRAEERRYDAAEQAAERARRDKEQATLEADIIVRAEARKRELELAAEAEAEQIRRKAQGEADAIYAKMEAEARGAEEILKKQAAGFAEVVKSAGGDAEAALKLLIADKLEDLMRVQVDAIKNIKIDKVTVWDSGAGNANGKTSTAGFLSGLMQSVPPLEELFSMAGLSLPEFLGKRKDSEPEKIEVTPSPEDIE